MKLFFSASLVSALDQAAYPKGTIQTECRLSRSKAKQKFADPHCLDRRNRELECSDQYPAKECALVRELLLKDHKKVQSDTGSECVKTGSTRVELSWPKAKRWVPLECHKIPSTTDYYQGDVDEDTKAFNFDVDDIASYEGLPKRLKKKMDRLLRLQACAAKNKKSCTYRPLTTSAIRAKFRSAVCAIPKKHRLAAKRIVEMTWADAAKAGPQVNNKNVSRLRGQATASWLLQDQRPCSDEAEGLPQDEMVLLSDIDDTWHYSKQPDELKKQAEGAIAGSDFRTNALHPIEQDSYYLNKELWMDEFVPKFFNTIAGQKGWTTASSAKPYPFMKYKWSQAFRKVSTTLWTWKKQAGRQFIKEGPQHVAIGQQPGKGGKSMVGAFASIVKNLINRSQHTHLAQFEEQLAEMSDVAANKADHFVRFIESFPELAGQVAFIGDDGQGDFASMRSMLRHKTNGKWSLRFGALKITHLMTKEAYNSCKENVTTCPKHTVQLGRQHFRTSAKVLLELSRKHKQLIRTGRLFLFTSYQDLARQLKQHKNTRVFGQKFN